MNRESNARDLTVLYPAAVGLKPRIQAFLYDYIVLSCYLVAVTTITAGVNAFGDGAVSQLFTSQLTSQALGLLTVTLPISLYFAVGESSKQQGTWGKVKLGVQVVGLDGERISFARALARTAIKFIPWEIAHWCIWHAHFHQYEASPALNLGIIVLWSIVFANLVRILRSPRHQSIYDWFTGTLVTRGQE